MAESSLLPSLAWVIAALAVIVAVVACIAYRRQVTALESLRRSERLYRLFFERSKDVLAVSTPEGQLIDINPAGVELYGYDSKQQMLTIDTAELYVDPQERRRILEELGKRGFIRGYEARYKRRSGEMIIMQSSTAVARDDDDTIEYLLSIMRDVTAQKRAEEKLLHLARFDSSTGLPNRHTFLDQLSKATARVGRFGHRMAILAFDLEPLDSLTDSHGSEAGEALLLAFARRLGANIRRVDTLARIGFSRFAVLKSDFVDRQDPVKLAERLIADCEKSFEVLDDAVAAPICIGIALYPPGDGEPEPLLERADRALSLAKAQGPGSYAFDADD